jgi:hypothetical protein
LGAYSAAAFAAFLAFDQTVRQRLGDPSDVAATVRPNFQVRRKAAGGPCELVQFPRSGLERSLRQTLRVDLAGN